VRTVIYARFSSRLQDDSSIEQQIAMCTERAEREGWEVVGVFTDYAISGKAGLSEQQRPGVSALLDRVRAGGVDQVLAESTDRLARHQGDDFAIRELLDHAGVRLFTLLEGLVDEITGTIKGLMNARFRKDLAARVKRGQRAAVSQGRAAAGIAFGYRRANRLDERGDLVRGLREIDPDKADIVRRIFRDYASGISPQFIAEALNAEGVPSPSGRHWTQSVIRGDRKRHNGILVNRLYAGELVLNRTSKVMDPRTRRSVIRTNPESDWIITQVPELRIVPDDTWQAVQARIAETKGKPRHDFRRKTYMLSGMGRCGVCGGNWIRVDRELWGCTRHANGRVCTNGRKIANARYEAEVLAHIQGPNLLDPDLVAAYVREYHREHARQAGEVSRERTKLERKIAEANRKIARLVDAIGKAGDIEEIVSALAGARAERDRCSAELDRIETLPFLVLHPNIAEDYRRQAVGLAEALADEHARPEAIPRLRALIDTIALTPRSEGCGVDVSVSTRFDAIVRLATTPALEKARNVA
jgi:DNA invertase Pin-like site-specific DNA recombinase